MRMPELDEEFSVQSDVIDNTKNPLVYYKMTLANGKVLEGWMPNPDIKEGPND